MKNDLISVIVPVYKVEKYLNRCVDSILAQTYTDLEIILVDDGSPDNCGKICDEYATKDSRIKVIHQKNGGLSAARNAGLGIAMGKYVGFVDSDDYIAPDMYEKLYNAIVSNEADMSVCDYQKVGNKQLFDDGEMCLLSEVISGREAMARQYEIINCSYVVAWSKLYKRFIWDDLRFPIGKINEDEFVSFNVFEKSKRIAVISDKLYYYNIRPDSIMGAKESCVHPDYLDALYARSEFIQNNGYENLYPIFWKGFSWTFRQYIRFSSYYKKSSRGNKNLCINNAKNLCKIYRPYTTCKERFIFNHPHLYIAASKVKRVLIELKKPFVQIAECIIVFIGSRHKSVVYNTPLHGNLGDQAIALSEKQLLDSQSKFYEVPASLIVENPRAAFIASIGKKVIYIHGGGNIGCLWPKEEKRIQEIVLRNANRKIIIFPQSVTFDCSSDSGIEFYKESKRVYCSHSNLVFFVREKNSFEFVRNNMPNVKTLLVPDIVLNMNIMTCNYTRDKVLFCTRKDREKVFFDFDAIKKMIKNKYPDIPVVHIDNDVYHVVEPKNREQEVLKQLNAFSGAKLVITDRLHGMIFSAITNTPCIAVDNCNGKVSGVYEWVKRNEYIRFCRTLNDVNQALETLDIEKRYSFDKTSIEKAMKPLLEGINNA